MKQYVRNILSALLVLILVMGVGFHSFSSNGESIELENAEESIEVMGVEYEELSYIVKYFKDGIEQPKWQKDGEVSKDNPRIEKVEHDNMPEGYILDEKKSTALPFEVGEENNIIEVHYMRDPEVEIMDKAEKQSTPAAISEVEDEVAAMAANGLQNPYYRDSELFELEMIDDSTNNHTKAIFAWLYEGDLYLAIGSMHNKPLQSVKYGNNPIINNNPSSFHRANEKEDPLCITDSKMETSQNYYVSTYINKEKPRWNVVNLGNVDLISPFSLGVEVGGGGHDIIPKDGEDNVEIQNSVLVYHRYGDELIFDHKQSKFIEKGVSYSVSPVNKKDYELVDIERKTGDHSEIEKVPLGNLMDNMLSGTLVDKKTVSITFIYGKVQRGELTITKDVANCRPQDKEKEFHIFIRGADKLEGKVYTVSLKHGKSATITDLEYGTYTIKELVPMNFQKTPAETITISEENQEQSMTIINKRVNYGWFSDSVDRINKFTMATNSK
ncbi:MAG: hypothetical protein GX329_01865 [Tissierellia bacterium]|nr:hypothetical protein [Tissierellia bacterium]